LAETLIGIDIGTTAVKAVLIDLAGKRLGEFSRPYPIRRPEPGAAEQDSADWMAGVLEALSAFESDHDLRGLLAIGLSSQVNTHVFVGSDGKPLKPALVWQDQRAAPDGEALERRISAEQKLAWLGAPIPIDASHALARMAYMRRTDPQTFSRTRWVLQPRDYCLMALTGEVASDPVSAIGLVGRRGYVLRLLDLVPGAAAMLPELAPITHVAGKVRPGLPCAGVPVVAGTMDAWAGMFGVGVMADGDAMLQSGTSEIAGIVSTVVHPTSGVIVFPPYEGITLHAAPTQSGGAALAWFAQVVGKTPATVSSLAGSIAPSSAVPIFLPHLQGERAPLWDSASRGVFARIDPRAGAPEMSRAVMEGVAFSVRLAFDVLQQSAGRALDVANMGGGGARSDVWCQIRADVLGFALRRTTVPDAAALGAALLAGVGSGALPSLKDGVAALVKFERTFEPDAATRAYYHDKFAAYQALYETMRPFNARY
jgi:xylulokinase